MPPSVRSVSTASHDTGTVTVTKPSGTVAGDRLVAICTRDEGAGTGAWGSNLFTLVNASTISGVGRIQVWQRTAGSSEPASYTYTDSSGNSTGTVHLFALQDVDPTAVVVAAFNNGAAATSVVAPSIPSANYTGVDPLLLCGFYGLINTGARTWTAPSGMTGRGTITPPFQYTSAFAASLGLSGTPATGTRTATMSSPGKPWIACSVVIPSTAAPPQELDPSSIPSAEAWGTPTITPGAASVATTSIASAEAFGTPTVAPGAVPVGASGIPTSEAWGTPALQQTITLAGIGSAEAWGTPTVNVGPTVAPTGIPSAEAWGSPAVIPGVVSVGAAGVESAEAWGTPTVLPLIKPEGIPSAEAWGAPALLPGAVAVYPSGIPSAEAWGAPIVVPGPISAAATGVPSAEAWGTPTLRLHVVPGGIPSAEAWGAPTVLVGSVTIFPSGIPSAEAWGIPALTVTIDPTVMRGILTERTGPRYELVCVARLPASAGPPTFEEVERVPLRTLSWSSALSSAQTLSATCSISSLPEPVLQRLRKPDELATEFWLNRDGRRVFAGPFMTLRPVGGEYVAIDALGIYAYLQYMFLTFDMPFAQVDQHFIAKALVDHWQEHPTIRHGHFGIDTSAVTPSGVLRDRTYVAMEGHQVSRRVQELGAVEGGFDSEIDPTTRRLELWTPQKGVDRSTGSDAIVLDRRNIADPGLAMSAAPGDLASVAIGTSSAAGADTALWSIAINQQLAAAYGAAGVMSSWQDISEQGTLDGHVNAMLAARAGALVAPGPRTRVTADADISAYDVGDTVAFDDFVLGISGAWRIRKRTVDVAESGEETASLEFV
ncbi:hypothetical protein Psed_5805 [Pseudonocardia dioxanivorans CB1190]|uniref:Uncharacterized protein n=1 Tax=Pseudonocardia dioxanivorans (strain ATCC 55486 / DSM 44775 / JCM 13855 / CB1190) TaxID=675635 RepID=F4D1E4_PSEUX|nr:hypothetical protein [Pseudonocardia dioxanivorans]AEA27932.1 hypothetical protein Psed_5805 [Pseudonocardia dioxanivorans CB1190]